MQRKWIYPLLLVFLAFFVLSNPESAGPQARSFFGWVGDQAEAFGTFLDGVFADEGGAVTTSPPEPTGGGEGSTTDSTVANSRETGETGTGGDDRGADAPDDSAEDGFVSGAAVTVVAVIGV